MVTRRQVTASGLLALAGLSGRARAEAVSAAGFAGIEARTGGRLGVAVLDTASDRLVGHREHERFPMCSTFKVLAAAAVLARIDSGSDRLERRVVFETPMLVPYSPVTERRVGGAGMTLAELCEAAITRSDNTAGNLLLAAIGGPEGLTAYIRGLGDAVTRLDRIEPDLNEARPGDARDTTSPAAMAGVLRRLVLGDGLSAASRSRLADWMIDNRTGGARLRAGLPAGWRIGDKTGTGDRGTANDIAVIWPVRAAPLVVAVYLTESDRSLEERNAAIAAVGRAVSA
ncbi:MAG: class A beta-lactamase [Methylorubrum populi]